MKYHTDSHKLSMDFLSLHFLPTAVKLNVCPCTRIMCILSVRRVKARSGMVAEECEEDDRELRS